tara:strand:- start:11 stop:493 length:483 start_codon:yes stop_codon:yes gene_type:complete
MQETIRLFVADVPLGTVVTKLRGQTSRVHSTSTKDRAKGETVLASAIESAESLKAAASSPVEQGQQRIFFTLVDKMAADDVPGLKNVKYVDVKDIDPAIVLNYTAARKKNIMMGRFEENAGVEDLVNTIRSSPYYSGFSLESVGENKVLKIKGKRKHSAS